MKIATYPSAAAEQEDRAALRATERELDRELRQRPLNHGRVWSEHTPGLHQRCSACGRVGRTWVGRYYVHHGERPGMPYSIHASAPLCAYHAIAMQRAEWGVPHMRSADLHARIGHA